MCSFSFQYERDDDIDHYENSGLILIVLFSIYD